MSMETLHSKMDKCLTSLVRMEEQMKNNREKLDHTEAEVERVDGHVQKLDKKVHKFWYILCGILVSVGGPELFKIVKAFI